METEQGRTRGSKKKIENKEERHRQIKNLQNQIKFYTNIWNNPGNGRRPNDIVVRNNKIAIPKQEVKPNVDTDIPEYSLHQTVENGVQNEQIIRIVKDELDLPVEGSVECAKELKSNRVRKNSKNGLQNLGTCSSAKKVCSVKVEQVEKNKNVNLEQIQCEAYWNEEIDSGNLENFQGARREQNEAIEVIDLSAEEEPFEVIDLEEMEVPPEVIHLEEEENSFVTNANINLTEENASEAAQTDCSVHTSGNIYNVNCHPNQKNLEQGEIAEIPVATAGSNLTNFVNQYDCMPSSSKAVNAGKIAKLNSCSSNGAKLSCDNHNKPKDINFKQLTEGSELRPSVHGHGEENDTTLSPKVKPLAEIHGNCQELLPNPEITEGRAGCKSTLLFPQVTRIIWENFEYSLLNKLEFLNTRLVCPIWMQAVDQLEEGPIWALQFEESILLQSTKLVRWLNRRNRDVPISPYASESVQKIVSDSLPPVKLRVIDSLIWGLKDRRTKCWGFITNLLKTHGKIVKVFAYNKGARKSTLLNCRDPESFFRVFVSWLELMPNLEEINLLECKSIYKINCTRELPEFPTLSKLLHLNDYRWPPKLFRAAILANAQIQSLKITNRDFDFRMIMLPQLKKLVINFLATPRINSILHSTCDYLRTLPLLNAPCLESLIFKGPVSLEIYPLALRALRKFCTSLENFELTFNFRCPGKDYVLPDMPKLKTLVLNFSPIANWCTNDLVRFVSRCLVLESLVLQSHSGCNCKYLFCSLGSRSARRTHIQEELAEKLWSALPNLKVEVIPDMSSNTAKLETSFVFIPVK